MKKTRSSGPKLFLAILGMALGGYIGFLNRPAAFLVGQLPLSKIILAGTNLNGLERVLAPVARTSFTYMVIGAIIGFVSGLILSAVLVRKKR